MDIIQELNYVSKTKKLEFLLAKLNGINTIWIKYFSLTVQSKNTNGITQSS